MFRELMIKDVVRIMNGKSQLSDLELVRGVAINSKCVKPGELFFALKGRHTDGHFYCKEAVHNGAIGVVVEHNHDAVHEILVSDTLFSLGELARAYRRYFNPMTIAITGTNGKTTVKKLIVRILSKKYCIMYTKKNYNSLIGLPLTIFNVSGDEDYLVLEMGTSNPGEIKRLCDISKPHIGMITNIGPGHLDGLNTINGIREEKLSLINALPRNGLGFIGEGVGPIEKRNVKEFSLDMVDEIRLTEYGSWFTYDDCDFFTPLIGVGNVYNCLAAIFLTDRLGFDHRTQKEALAEVRPEPGRLVPIRHNRFLIIDDTYNANPLSMKVAIDFVSSLKRRRILVLGDMLELGRDSKSIHKEIGDYAKGHADLIITFGTEASNYGGKHFSQKVEIISYLTKNLRGDEVILVKASRSLKFEEIVKKLLEAL